MQTKFKRHQKVTLLLDPDPEYIEYSNDSLVPIKKGMHGKINLLLSNGKYHVQIMDNKNETIAYVLIAEEDLEENKD